MSVISVQVLSLPGSVLWATIFFVMLLVLGIDSEFCNVEALVTGMVDNWPDTLLKHRRLFTICLCFGIFCLGIPLVTNVSYKMHADNRIKELEQISGLQRYLFAQEIFFSLESFSSRIN